MIAHHPPGATTDEQAARIYSKRNFDGTKLPLVEHPSLDHNIWYGIAASRLSLAPHFPHQTGLRFSRNAPIPSCASSASAFWLITSFVYS
jgi:hypothetical protein